MTTKKAPTETGQGVEIETGGNPSMSRQDVTVKGDEQSERRGITWTRYRRKQAEQIISVVNGLSNYWPLTLRQIYYRLVAAGIIANTRSKYNDLSKLTKQMRLDGMSALSVLSLVGQGIADVRRGPRLDGPCSLFLIGLGQSGERKTTADDAFSHPIRQWQLHKQEEASPLIIAHGRGGRMPKYRQPVARVWTTACPPCVKIGCGGGGREGGDPSILPINVGYSVG